MLIIITRILVFRLIHAECALVGPDEIELGPVVSTGCRHNLLLSTVHAWSCVQKSHHLVKMAETRVVFKLGNFSKFAIMILTLSDEQTT